MELVDDLLGASLAHGSPGICALTANLVLDLIEPADAQQGLGCDRRIAAFGDVVKTASKVAPAEGQRHLGQLRFVQPAASSRYDEAIVGCVAVDLQDAAEAGEMMHGMPAAAARRIHVSHRWRIGAAPRSVVAGDRPEIA